MTRARNELHLCVPLKFLLTQQSRQGDAHVYGGRSRFVNDKVLKCMEPATFHGAHLGEAPLGEARAVTVDVGARLKDMW
jgi:DNA helicase-2/ATP-dependent DNA helicase PcrA